MGTFVWECEGRRITLRDDEWLFWGDVPVPESFANKGFAFVGSPGSGKSVLLKLLMASTLTRACDPEWDVRGMVFDDKGDALANLASMGLHAPLVKSMNPLDTNGYGWDMATDISSPSYAATLARTLIPSEKGHANAHFVLGAQAVLSGVVEAFVRWKKKRPDWSWTLRDVLLAFRSVSDIATILRRDPDTRSTYESFIDVPNREAYLSDVKGRIRDLNIVAACWQHAKLLSLKEWLKKNWILVLPKLKSAGATVDAVNELLIAVASQLIHDGPNINFENSRRRTWMYFDELAEAGNLKELPTLLSGGRSKGVCGVLAFQSNKSLDDAMGKEGSADRLVAMCRHFVALNLGTDASTASWAAKIFGKKLQHELQIGETVTKTKGKEEEQVSKAVNKNWQTHLRDNALASELQKLPIPDSGWLGGVYFSTAVGMYRRDLPVEPIFHVLNASGPANGSVDDFVERPSEHQDLEDWSASERAALDLPATKTNDESPDLGRYDIDDD